MTIRILHVISDDLWGGAEAQVNLLIKTFKLEKYKDTSIQILTFNNGTLSKNLKESVDGSFIAEERNGIFPLIINSIKATSKIRPNIIISHGYKEAVVSIVLSKIFGCKWIHQVHGSSENYSGIKKLKASLYSFIEKTLARYLANKVIFISKATKSYFGFDNRDNAFVIYNASKFIGAVKSNYSTNPFEISVIGRIAPIKRIDLAIEAFEIVSQRLAQEGKIAILNIIGDGPLHQEIQKKAGQSKFSDNIVFHGFVNNVDALLCKSSLLLLTSDNEGIPTVILEAAHSKVPIVSRDVGGLREIKGILDSYPLFLVNSSSPMEISDAIWDAFKQYANLLEMAKSSDTRYFLPSRCAKEHFELYSTLV